MKWHWLAAGFALMNVDVVEFILHVQRRSSCRAAGARRGTYVTDGWCWQHTYTDVSRPRCPAPRPSGWRIILLTQCISVCASYIACNMRRCVSHAAVKLSRRVWCSNQSDDTLTLTWPSTLITTGTARYVLDDESKQRWESSHGFWQQWVTLVTVGRINSMESARVFFCTS